MINESNIQFDYCRFESYPTSLKYVQRFDKFIMNKIDFNLNFKLLDFIDNSPLFNSVIGEFKTNNPNLFKLISDFTIFYRENRDFILYCLRVYLYISIFFYILL